VFNLYIEKANEIVVNKAPIVITSFSKPVLIANNEFSDNTGVRGIIFLIASNTV